MKKIYNILLIFLLFLSLAGCNNVGHPTIKYTDNNGNEQSEVVSASSNKEYVKKIVNLLNSIQPEKYSYQMTTQIKQSFECVLFEQGQNKKNVNYSFSSNDMLIYDHINDVTYNKIQSLNIIADKDIDSIYKSDDKSIVEHIYSDGYSYINENNNKIKIESNKGYLKNNIFYELNLEVLFDIKESFVDDYNLYISDCNKNNIKFCIDGKKLFNKDTKIFIYVSPHNGLVNKIYYEETSLGYDKLKSMFTETIMVFENITNSIGIIQFEFIYDNVPDINLTEEQKLEYKSTSAS